MAPFHVMFRIVLLAVLALLLPVHAAFSQEKAGIRLGEHEGYSRLVFDLGKAIPYTVETGTPGKLVVAFKEGAAPGDVPAKTQALRNISGFEILAASPLRISIDIPRDSRVRHFTTGDRLIVDVYNSPSGIKQSAATPEKKEPEKKEPAAVKPETPKPKTESVPQPDPAELKEPDAPQEVKKDTKESRSSADNAVLTLTSTKSVGLAAFRRGGELWIVADKPDLLTPQITGRRAKEIGTPRPLGASDGKAWRAALFPGAQVGAEGGGLLWRLLVSADKKDSAAIRPVTRETAPGQMKLLWPFKEPGLVIDVTDPVTGAVIRVVTVKDAKEFAGPAYKFVEFDVLDSPAGLAILPKIDDLAVTVTPEGAEISRSGGLAVSKQSLLPPPEPPKAEEETQEEIVDVKDILAEEAAQAAAPESGPIFDFKDWQMGGVAALEQNKNIILADIKAMPEARQMEEIVTLAKMYIANGQGAEALGFLRIAEAQLPGLAENPQFAALRGAADALSWKSERAFEELSADNLQSWPEIQYWRAFALADLGDWNQAGQVIPDSIDTLKTYPDFVFNRLAPVLAEIALRSGKVEEGQEILAQMESRSAALLPPQQAALAYLKGEAARQRGDIDQTKKFWEPLTLGSDDLYRAKAGLALTRLLAERKEIDTKAVIDRLERLRYAWRGDDLEAQINYWLARTYFEDAGYVKGLNIMNEALSFSSDPAFSARIRTEMTETFADLFLGEKLKKVSPVDAVALYEQFAALVPEGEPRDRITEALAEHLVQSDLMDRAAALLAEELKHLSGFEAYRVNVRLAGIRLLDKKPAEALTVLQTAETLFNALPGESRTAERAREIPLMRAHAMALQGHPQQALDLLETLGSAPEVNRLKADIAWNAGYWDDAADALAMVIDDRSLSLTRPLDTLDATLILHRAVALNLADDRVALSNLRGKYGDAMAQTGQAKVFELITRPRQSAALADRETLTGIVSEVDLFGDFLKNFGKAAPPVN